MSASDADRLAALADRFSDAPGEEALAGLRAFVDAYEVGFLDLDRRLPNIPTHGWTSRGLIVRPQVELSVFFLRDGGEIPIHDHPGLHGLMRLLRGRLRITAWDWVEPGQVLAREVLRAEFSPGDLIPAIHPDRRAVHRVEALEDAAFLDLFVPPYPPDACTYFRVAGPGPDGTVRLVPSRALG